MLKKGLAIVAAAIVLTACSNKIPVDVRNGTIETNFDFGPQQTAVDQRLVIVTPEAEYNGFQGAGRQQPAVNPLAQMFQTAMAQGAPQVDYVREDNIQKVRRAFAEGLERLITTSGFTYSGPYDNFDEVVYGDKKNAYLAMVPKFDIRIGPSNVKREEFRSFVRESGIIRIEGEFLFKFIEPLTGQVIMQKRVDLNKLGIAEQYVREREITSGGNGGWVSQGVSAALKEASKPDVLVDDYGKAYANAMSRFYQGTMEQLVRYFSVEELLTYETQVNELKGSKRF